MAKKKTIKGTLMSDWLFGTTKGDTMDGLKGDDYVSGLLGSDKLHGADGDDTLYGGDGNDSLWGDDDNDVINGGLGNDKLFGGDGDDGMNGGEGNDNLAGGIDKDYLNGDKGNDKLSGDAGDDQLSGGDGNDRLLGGEGRDYLSGDNENDRLDGGAGNDSLYGGRGVDNLSGGNGNDFLDGSDDTDRDVLNGGAGRDKVSVFQGDVALGGKDIDTLVMRSSFSTNGAVKYEINLSGITGKKAADTGFGGAKAGQFEKASVSFYNAADGSSFVGSKGDDTLVVYGTSGTVNGGAGNDQITVFGYGSDTNPDLCYTVEGGAGNDRIMSSGKNVIAGGAGSDLFVVTYSSGAGTILDFTSKDSILLNFWDYETTTLDRANVLVSGADPVATSAMGQFLYDTDDGRLFIDPDGTAGTMELLHVFTFANKAALTAANFIINF